MNNLAVLIGSMERHGPLDASLSVKYQHYVLGLQWHNSWEPVDYSTLDDAAREGGMALVTAASIMGPPYCIRYRDGFEDSVYIPSKHLKSLISRRPREVDKIVRILRERRLGVSSEDEIAIMEPLLDGSSSGALVSGVL